MSKEATLSHPKTAALGVGYSASGIVIGSHKLSLFYNLIVVHFFGSVDLLCGTVYSMPQHPSIPWEKNTLLVSSFENN